MDRLKCIEMINVDRRATIYIVQASNGIRDASVSIYTYRAILIT